MSEHTPENDAPLCSCSVARVGDVDEYAAEVVHHVRYPADCYAVALCGHTERVRGCGGCDPGAIEYVRDDGGPWTRVLPPGSTEGAPCWRGCPINVGTGLQSHQWPCDLSGQTTRVLPPGQDHDR